MNFAAEVVVLDAETGEIKSNIPMGERGDDMTRSAIAVPQGNLFIRTNTKLYCIGK